MNQVLTQFGDIEPFLEENRHSPLPCGSPACSSLQSEALQTIAGSSRIADRSVLTRQCLPAILRTERSHVQQAIARHPVAAIFDGSTCLGKVPAVIIRFSDNEWSPRQVLVRLKALAESLTGEQLAGELIDVLATQLQVPRARVIAAMRDGASVDDCVLRAVKALYRKDPQVLVDVQSTCTCNVLCIRRT